MPDRSPAVVPGAEQRYSALAVRSRRQLLDVLRAANGPVCAGELAAAVGLHVTTARAHLRVLEVAGLVLRSQRPPSGPGRPRQFFEAVAEDGFVGEHRRLAELLAGALATGGEEGCRRAEEAGRRWAQREVPAAGHLSWERAVEEVGEMFERMGFAPRRVDADRPGYRLALDGCPFRDVARVHPDVVCTLHLGLLRGALARFGLPELAESGQLRPFVAPELCMAEVPAPGARHAEDRRRPTVD